jgi:CRISPR-associated protein Cmr2
MAKFLLVYSDMPRYVAITFAPIQSFIEKSRKLRDLYGSSFILSFLAKAICKAAVEKKLEVIKPALIDVTRGTPNTIYLYGSINESKIKDITNYFYNAWTALVKNCRLYIEEECAKTFEDIPSKYGWEREWQLWSNHMWELFVVCGEENDSLETVKSAMANRKQSRDWIGINWRGESSTLSGVDALAYPQMAMFNPTHSMGAADEKIRNFYTALSELFVKIEKESLDGGQTTQLKAIEDNERLSIPELIKRLITYRVVVDLFFEREKHSGFPPIERLERFTPLQRKESNHWTGWFQGDGDHMGAYIESLTGGVADDNEQNERLRKFSGDMLKWCKALQGRTEALLKNKLKGRIVYAGGDDFFGVLHRNDDSLTPEDCLKQFWYHFDDLWGECGHDISVSTGFVWAAPNVPQRDLLQHLRQTGKAAKDAGRDRLAIRILFNSGNHLDWQCPWRYLEEILEGYCDRNKRQNWTHIHSDIAMLEARQAFGRDSDGDCSVAQAIFNIYFPKFELEDNDERLWTPKPSEKYERLQSGLLGLCPQISNPPSPKQLAAKNKCFNQWVIGLAQVGFHLFPDH